MDRLKIASMGPRSADRGIATEESYSPSPVALQWGRDQLIAEFTLWTEKELERNWLQWGRDQLIAELAISR